MTDSRTVSIIMPTRAVAERGHSIRRALESVLARQDVRAVAIVVVNGPDRDAALVRELQSDRRLKVVVIEQPGLAEALRAGRRLVDTPWFGELDDDDFLLPGTLVERLDALAGDGAFDVAVSNGYRRDVDGRDVPNIVDAAAVHADPVRAMLVHNWLLPGSWVCRTDAVSVDFFDGMPRFLECTYLALMFATRRRTIFLDRPGVVWHCHAPGSLSSSRAYAVGQADALRHIVRLDLPLDVRRAYRRRVSDALHGNADRCRHEGLRGEAWRWHLRSLREPGGWRYLPFTRHLVAP